MASLPLITRMSVGNQCDDISENPKDLGSGRIYYISASSGNDQNDGLSPATAWQTVGPINQLDLKSGDNVLFCRGDVFLGQHLMLHGKGIPNGECWITVDSYGLGAAPRFQDGVLNEPAISLPHNATGYRIRHLEICGYLVGIAANGNESAPLDGIQITNCTIRDCTINADMDFRPQLPCGSPLACALLLQYVRNVEVRCLTIDNTDCPLRFCGGYSVFDQLDIRRSHIQGMMIYGVYDRDSYEDIMAADGYVTVENTRVLYTGDRATRFGSTGCLVENIHHCTIRNVEVGYTVNTLSYFDACAVDWEQSNIDCVFEDIYAHDNQGPFVLAMEHPESLGNSRRNIIRGCVSVNNATFGGTESSSFINYSSYNNEEQRIRIENCMDIAAQGTVAYTKTSKQEAGFADSGRKIFPLIIEGFTANELDVAERFLYDHTTIFSRTERTQILDGQLVIHPNGYAITEFFGEDYVVSCWLKGSTELWVRKSDDQNGYVWRFAAGKILIGNVRNGAYTLMKTISLMQVDTDDWFRVRVEVNGYTLSTYIDDQLVDTLNDVVHTGGHVALASVGGIGVARELYVYRYVSGQQKLNSFEIKEPKMDFVMDSAHGEFGFFSPEVEWIPENLKTWQYRPFRIGWGEIDGYEATLTRKNFDVDVTKFTHLQIIMINCTRKPQVWLEFTTDGETWHQKSFTTACIGSTEHPLWRVLFPACERYVLDMRDMPEWTGRVVGLRLRFAAGWGRVAVKTVTLYCDSSSI